MEAHVATAVGVAALLVALGHALTWRRDSDDDMPRGWRGPLAAASVALAFAFTQFFLAEAAPQFPPRDATHWLSFLAVIGVFLASLPLQRRAVLWAARVSFITLGVLLLTAPMREHSWSVATSALHVSVYVSLIVGSWAAVGLGDEADATLPFGLALAAAAGAATIAYATSLVTGLLVGTLALGLGASAVTTWLGSTSAARAVRDVFVPMLGFSFVVAHAYTEMTGWALLLLSLAPAAVVLAGRVVPGSARLTMGALRVALAVGPAAIALPVAEYSLRTDGDTTIEVDEDGSYVPY